MPMPKMERSISLDSSNTNTNYNNKDHINHNNNNNEHDNENMHSNYSTTKTTAATAATATTTTTTQLRKALALRQSHQQQQQQQYPQQQHHQQQLQQCNENLSNQIATTNTPLLHATATITMPLNRQQQQTQSQPQTQTQMKSLKGPLTHFLPKRKRQLQRQKPMEHSDDMDYAADLEEEDEDEEVDVNNDVYVVDDVESHAAAARCAGDVLGMTAERIAAAHHYTPAKLHLAPAHQKRLQFQKYRQHSNLAMIPTTPNSPPFNGTASAMSNCSPPCPLPAHSLAHHATRSSSTSSATSLDSHFKHQDSFESTVSLDTPQNRRQQFFALKRDNSIQSDSSRYSSLECMLEARKPDPEAILINLGFGPVNSDDILSRIPSRFLKPSQVRGIDTEAFVKRLQLQLQLADHSVLGYRGLTGNPDMPPSSIVAKIMQRFEVNERKKSMGSLEHAI